VSAVLITLYFVFQISCSRYNIYIYKWKGC